MIKIKGILLTVLPVIFLCAKADSSYNLYFGNLHAHTSYSDGIGTPEEAFKLMRESKAGDFGAITDHSKQLMDNLSNWEKTKKLADKYTDKNFVAIAGCEVLLGYETGEMCTFGIEDITHKKDAPDFYDWLVKNENSISQFNHPKAYPNQFYDFVGRTSARNNHIKLIEYSNADWDKTYLDSYMKALNAGWLVAPSANSDTHKGKWLVGCDNRTVVLAKSLSRSNIFDAIRNRRVYATEDKNLRISYTVNGEVMGRILSNPSSLKFNVSVNSPSGNKIEKLELYADGKLRSSKNYSSTSASWSFTLTPSYGYYFIKVNLKDGKTAVTAPIWIDKSSKKSTQTNLALNKSASCSSVEEGKDYVAKNAVDGNEKSRWGIIEGKSNAEWLKVDLGQKMKFNKVVIKWEAAYATHYQIQVSNDGKNFTTVSKTSNFNGNSNLKSVNTFDSVNARYVRVYCTGKATKYGYSIYEFEVYNA